MKYCDDYAALLDLYVDGELDPEEMSRVQAHLDACPGCRAYVDDALAIRAAFPGLEETVVPDGFADSVMAAIQATPNTVQAAPRKRRAPWSRILLPLAACCAIVVLLQGLPLSSSSKKSAAPAAMDTAESTEAPAEAADMEIPGEPESEAESSMKADARIFDYDTTPSAMPADGTASQDSSKEAYSIQDNTASVTFGSSPLISLTLAAEDAGSLLEAYTPVQETDTECLYELSCDEWNTLLPSLIAAGVVSEEESQSCDSPEGTALIIVEK